MAASRSSERNAREIYEMKQRAVKFYRENQVPEKIEDILNAMFHENPDDIYGRLSEYFESLAKPGTISKLVSRLVLDSKGQPTVQCEVHCIVKGVERHLSTSSVASHNTLAESAPIERKEADDLERLQFVEAAIEYINGPLCEKIKGLDPTNQKEIDSLICETLEQLKAEHEERERKLKEEQAEEETPQQQKEPVKEEKSSPKAKKKGSAKSAAVVAEEPKEQFFVGCNSICALSQSVLQTAATLKKVQLFEYVASLRYNEAPDKYRLPLPMASILNFGKAAACKLNLFKEVMIMPKPDKPLSEAIKQISDIYNQVGKTLFTKYGVAVKNVNDLGCFIPAYDKPEQALDVLQESITQLGFTPGEDFHIVLNCAAHEMFDMDKGKYEMVTGVFKGPDDMVEVYNDLVTRYPAIIAIIDPLKRQDSEPWLKLCEKLSEKCYIIGGHVYPRTERFLQEGFGDVKSSAVVLKQQQMTSVSDTIDAVKFLEGEGLDSVISCVQGESGDSSIADLAVGMGSKFIQIGAPCRGERVCNYNRLLQIESWLKDKDALSYYESHEFPNILPPPPPEEPVDEVDN
ncbi:enolase 4-like [Saccoglossus kowalevskii]|uniref:Enolase 4 n=1 Tax=Saccoglossus kowalevskii TaxID=10224 RepID=A0ABM0GVF5_SACKO|nr:PREDICTED: enolase-like protein ENO4-like [Saccoglossus kowalevskii]